MSICSSPDPLRGHVAIVTGGAGGIGSAVVTELTELGAKVASLDLVIAQTPVAALNLACDVTQPAEVESAIAKVVETLGEVDILVLNAGMIGTPAPLTEVTLKRWQEVFAVNIDSQFYFVRLILGGMISRGHGRIILLSSGAALRPPVEVGAYAPSKAAVIGLGKLTALEGAESGVTCNIVAPGMVRTPMPVAFYGGDASELERMVTTSTIANPMKVVLEPTDIASTIAFLCLPAARYVTGQTLHVNAGGFMP